MNHLVKAICPEEAPFKQGPGGEQECWGSVEAGQKGGAAGPKPDLRAEGCKLGFKAWLRLGVLESTG